MERHGARVYVRLPARRGRLRVGLAGGLAPLANGTGHGNAWGGMLSALRELDEIKLVSRGRADVWLASGHAEPPTERPLVVQVFEASWVDPTVRRLLHPEFASQIDAATRAAVLAAQRVVTTSDAAREQVLRAYAVSPDRVHTVPLGVDHDVFHPGIPGGRELVGAPYVLFVALLHPRKNYLAVRRAVADLAARGLPHVLAIVGNLAPDPDALEFERQATAELPGHPGRVVRFRELPTERLAALMAGADLLCLPSYFEGFGLPVLESMACGTPVVVSGAGSLPEVAGDAGLVVAPDPEAVSEAVARVIDDPALASRLRAAGIERATHFSWDRTASGWVEVLRRVV